MEGWKLSSGSFNHGRLEESDIWASFNRIFSTVSKNQASYKFGFVRALLDNLYNVGGDLRLSYDEIFSSFTEIYWNLVIEHGLSQTTRSHKASGVETKLHQLRTELNIPNSVEFALLRESDKQKIHKAAKQVGKRYVVGAVYGDSDGTFYSFDNRSESLNYNEPVFRFMQKHQTALYKLDNYEFIRFLQANNPNDHHANLVGVVENLNTRKSLSRFDLLLASVSNKKCFYCGKLQRGRRYQIDHVVPWSYIHADHLWNLVLSCRSCNASKSNRLPAKEYLAFLLSRNFSLKNSADPDIAQEMISYSDSKMEELFYFCENGGYPGGWKPIS